MIGSLWNLLSVHGGLLQRIASLGRAVKNQFDRPSCTEHARILNKNHGAVFNSLTIIPSLHDTNTFSIHILFSFHMLKRTLIIDKNNSALPVSGSKLYLSHLNRFKWWMNFKWFGNTCNIISAAPQWILLISLFFLRDGHIVYLFYFRCV